MVIQLGELEVFYRGHQKQEAMPSRFVIKKMRSSILSILK